MKAPSWLPPLSSVMGEVRGGVMAGESQGSSVRLIQTLFEGGTTGGLSDAQLLDRFLDRREAAAELAFEELVMRHGPLVFDVCRNVLGGRQDSRGCLSGDFLDPGVQGSVDPASGVAGELAVRGRPAGGHEVEVRHRPAPGPRTESRRKASTPSSQSTEGQRDLSILIEEVEKLPAKYRDPVILCYFQGVTYEAAAQRLGCPLGTLSVRLKRAGSRLRDRLTRRGSPNRQRCSLRALPPARRSRRPSRRPLCGRQSVCRWANRSSLAQPRPRS